HLRRLARIFGVDDHLDVGEVGNGVERHAQDRIDAGQGDEDRRKADHKDVARRPADDSCDHFGGSGCVNACSAARRLLSASIKKVAEVTTSSPLPTPSRTSTYPSLRRPSLTGRGSKRPSPLTISTTWRAPLSITALTGTATTGFSSAPVWKTTSAYMSILSRPSGFGTSIRTRAVLVWALSSG